MDEISEQISSIQNKTNDSIEGIVVTIIQFNNSSASVAAAVEQQGAATQEIARNVEQAATGISDVSHTAGETGDAGNEVFVVSKELTQQSGLLRSEVNKLLTQIRAGQPR